MCMDVPGAEMRAQEYNEDVEILEAHVERVSLDKVTVKQERPEDEAEIRELAAKMVEANKAKMVSSGALSVSRTLGTQPSLPGILGYLSNTKRPADSSLPKNSSTDGGKVPLDDDSQRGRFGWTSFGKCHIPYILRAGERYCAVRILESKLLNKYLCYLHPDIYSCTCIRSFYITEAESKLFNEINMKHCENQFGRDPFTCKDLVVRLKDAKEFYTFLDMCYNKLTAGAAAAHNAAAPPVSQRTEKCGFIRINKESVVPYTVKDGLKYVPLFYFEGETDNLKLKAEKLEGWDLSYLKFCCKVQGIRNELFASETCSVISLSDIKSYFPPGTGFEDYWPSKVMDSQLLVTSKGGGGGGGWTKQPPTPPASKVPSLVQNNSVGVNKNSINVRSGQMQSNIVARGGVNNSATIQRVPQQQRSVVTTHPAHSSPSSRLSPARSNQVAQQPMLNAVQACNGWSGLVGGQPAFQTSGLVSQASQVIRMTNAPLNMHNQISSVSKTYSQQSRSRGGGGGAGAQYPGVYPVTTMQAAAQAQPPPLIRSTAHTSQPSIGYPTYGKDDWATTTYTTQSLGVPNAVSPSPYPHNLLGLSVDQVHTLMPSPQSMLSHPSRHTPPSHNSTTAKYPPPLLPVNGSTNNARDSRGRKPLITIADTPTSGSHVPYKVQKALVDEKMVPCINAKPYIYTELLMTLPDFVSQYFPTRDINECREVFTDVLGIDLYQGNRQQMQMLMEAGKCSSVNDELPLVQVRSIMQYMPQMKYVLNRRASVVGVGGGGGIPTQSAHSSEDHSSKKRQRTS